MATAPAAAAPAATPALPWRDRAKKRLTDELAELRTGLAGDIKKIEEETAADGTYAVRSVAYLVIVIAYLAVQLITGVVALYFVSVEVQLAEDFAIYPMLMLLLLQALHLGVSLRTIKVDDLACIDFFGRPLFEPKTGLYVVPRFILTLTITNRNYRDVRFPGHPDKIFRISAEAQRTSPTGDMPPADSKQVRPIYVTTGEPTLTPDERKERKTGIENPLDEQLNVEVAYFVRYRPNQEHGGIFRLIRNIGGIRGKTAAETQEVIVNLLQEQSERDIKSILTQQTYATTVENWALVNEVFALKLQQNILRLGIQIDPRGAGLDDANPSRGTNEAQMEVARERFRRNQTVIKADGEGKRIVTLGRSNAEADKLRLEALAKGYEKIKAGLGVDGDAVIASETVKAALSEKTDTLVLGTGGIEQLFGLVKAGQNMLEKNKPTASEPAPPASTPSGEKPEGEKEGAK